MPIASSASREPAGWECVGRSASLVGSSLSAPYLKARRAGLRDNEIAAIVGYGFLVGVRQASDSDAGLEDLYGAGLAGFEGLGFFDPDTGKTCGTFDVICNSKAIASGQGIGKTVVGKAAGAAAKFATIPEQAAVSLIGGHGLKNVDTGLPQAGQAVSDLGKDLGGAAEAVGKTVGQAFKDAIGTLKNLVSSVEQFFQYIGQLLLDLIRIAISGGKDQKAARDLDPFTSGSTMQKLLLNDVTEDIITLFFALLMLPIVLIGVSIAYLEDIFDVATGNLKAVGYNPPSFLDPRTPVRMLRATILRRNNGESMKDAIRNAIGDVITNGLPVAPQTIFHLGFYVLGSLPIPGPATATGILLSDPVLAAHVAQASGGSPVAHLAAQKASKVIGVTTGAKPHQMIEVASEGILETALPGVERRLKELGTSFHVIEDTLHKAWHLGLRLDLLFHDSVNPGGAQTATSLGITACTALLGGVTKGLHSADALRAMDLHKFTSGNFGLSGLGDHLGAADLGSTILGQTGIEAFITSAMKAAGPDVAPHVKRFVTGVTVHTVLSALTDQASKVLPKQAVLAEKDYHAAVYYLGKNHWDIPSALTEMQVHPTKRAAQGLGSFIDFAKEEVNGFRVPDATNVLPTLAKSDPGLALLVGVSKLFPTAAPALGPYLDKAAARAKALEGEIPSLIEHEAFRALIPPPVSVPPGVRRNAMVDLSHVANAPAGRTTFTQSSSRARKKRIAAVAIGAAGAGFLAAGPAGAAIAGGLALVAGKRRLG